MNKQRAQAIMEHIIAAIGESLDGWKLIGRTLSDEGLRCTWSKDLFQVSIIVLIANNEEGIIVCLSSPEVFSRRQFTNVSSASGAKAIKAVVRFDRLCQLDPSSEETQLPLE